MVRICREAQCVVVGGGLAGVRAALAAGRRLSHVVLVCKGRLFGSGSSFANINGGWGLTYGGTDVEREALYLAIAVLSQGTNIPALSRVLVEESERAVQDLLAYGARFRTDGNGRLLRVVPCFCTRPLALLLDNLAEIRDNLQAQLRASGVQTWERCRAVELVADGATCRGVVVERDGEYIRLLAPSVILATGGNAASWPRTIVSPDLTGDGYRLALEAGVGLINTEYTQWVWEDVAFHRYRFPVHALWSGRWRFRAPDGSEIDVCGLEENLVRQRRLHVPISNLQKDRQVDERFLRALADIQDGVIDVIDPATDRLVYRICPHAQASNGGIPIDEHGRTSLTGLFAAGEVAAGMHGGDRVGGTMITNCLVFGRRAGMAAARSVCS
ncbi:MAG TPA: FAD-dependent oxidoreductase [Desulfobulbus sp.]|nr:FAD-dependent oxidoreductase [Desulfobulbus sp.]